MKQFGNLDRYSVFEINAFLESLRKDYDIVRLVDVEECRILEVVDAGSIRYLQECYKIWGRESRCENCSSYQACKTCSCTDKTEPLGQDQEAIHSIPVSLELVTGELEMCVIECVKYDGKAPAPRMEERASYAGNYDVLTRLYNTERLFREIRRRLMQDDSGKYLLILGNIRNFKLVNRLFGIDGGNRLLVGIAELLREKCTKDEIYGRYRDDRFVLLLKKEKFSELQFLSYIDQVQEFIESPIFQAQLKLGICEVPDTDLPVSTLLEHADLAAGTIRDSRDRQIAWYNPGMSERKLHDQRIIASFEKAMENGEFQVYLQPQVRLDGKIIGAEALVRWAKDDDVLLPADFLGVLQQSELLAHLDMYVWEQTAAQLASWKGSACEDLYLSVNVDPSDFYYLDVPENLIQLCSKYEIDPKKLRIEITENALLEDMEQQTLMLDRLHQHGFIVEIDDFGKGSSSLSMLKDIHADVLKIDMGFLQGTTNLHRSRIIVRSVIKMSHNLNMDVITEGVETREQVEYLTEMGCQCFQGFYFSRPVCIADFEQLILGQ